MDIDHPVRNSTNNTVIESEVSEEVSDENTQSQIERYKETEICKHVNLGNRRNYNEGRDEKHQR